MTFRFHFKNFTHTPAALLLIAAACAPPATQGDTGSATGSATTDASTSTATTGPTSGISATGTGDSEGSGSDSNTTTEAATTEALTGTTDPTTGTTTTTTGETTDTTGPDPSTSSTGDTSTGDTSDTSTGDTGDTSTSDTGEPIVCGDTLLATVRDFKVSHPDFEAFLGAQLGLVETDLGVDKKPVYAHPGPTAVTSGPGNFAQWYNDVADVNQKTQIVLNLVEIQPGLFSYTNNDFFPIDGMLWGNEGNNRNFHLDDLGLQLGKTYPLDVFHAERHTSQSNFRIDTTICAIPQ